MSVSDVLKQQRKALNLTLLEIANRVGVSEATVQRWESGNIKNLRYERISKLAEVLKVSPAYLMGWDTDSPSKEPELYAGIDHMYLSLAKEFQDSAIDPEDVRMIMRLLDKHTKKPDDKKE